MKYTAFLLTFALSFSVAFAQTADAKKNETIKPADVAGTWAWSVPSRQEGNPPRESSLILKQDGGTLTGVYKTTRGETPISDGKVTGKNISFKVSRTNQQGGTMVSQYAGVVSENQIKGNITGKFGDRTFDREWTATRKIDVAGTWNRSIKLDNGQTMTSVLTLKMGDDNQITGKFKFGENETDIRNATLKGNELSFETVFERNGNSMTIKNLATVNGNMLKGNSSGSRDGQTWTREWTAERAK